MELLFFLRHGTFGVLTSSFCNFELGNINTGDGRYVQMVFDSGASITAFPPEIGEGYDLIRDEFVDDPYRGAGGEVIKDLGRRVINVLDENYQSKSMNHRVANIKSPLVAASQTVHAKNLVVMDEDFSFVVPTASEFGWHLKQAIQDLTWHFGTGECTTLYEQSGIYHFDTWIKPGPHQRPSTADAEKPLSQTSGGQPPEVSSVRVSGEVETKEFQIAEDDSNWQPVPKKKAATKKFMASFNHGNCEDGCCQDDGYWSGFTRQVPNWP